jgi:hypothetical protein
MRVPQVSPAAAGDLGSLSYPFENILFRHALVRGNSREDRVQRPNSEGIVGRNSDSMRRRLSGLQNDMAPDLMHSLLSPVLAKVFDQGRTAQIARQLHATASTSSRTKRRRIEAGAGESK